MRAIVIVYVCSLPCAPCAMPMLSVHDHSLLTTQALDPDTRRSRARAELRGPSVPPPPRGANETTLGQPSPVPTATAIFPGVSGRWPVQRDGAVGVLVLGVRLRPPPALLATSQ